MTREEAQPAWEKIVDAGFSDYQSLTKDQRVWFHIEPLTTGGITDHYVNYGAEHNAETISDLEMLGFADIAEMLRKVNRNFSNGEPPADMDDRNREISAWSAQEEAMLEEINDRFWQRSDELEKALLEYINRTGIGNNQ